MLPMNSITRAIRNERPFKNPYGNIKLQRFQSSNPPGNESVTDLKVDFRVSVNKHLNYRERLLNRSLLRHPKGIKRRPSNVKR